MSGEQFSIELTGFAQGDPTPTIHAISESFGVSHQDVTKLVERVPVVVKSQCDQTEAREYLKALLSAGAIVRVVGEGSGQVRTYTPSPEGGLPSVEYAAPNSTESITPRFTSAIGSSPSTSAFSASPKPEKFTPSLDQRPNVVDPGLAFRACNRCGHGIGAKDRFCGQCGWSHTTGRHCTQCAGKVRLSVFDQSFFLGVVAILIVVGGVLAWRQFGLVAAAVSAAGIGGVGLLGISLGLVHKCSGCGRPVPKKWLGDGERRARGSAGLFCTVAALSLFVVAGIYGPDAFGPPRFVVDTVHGTFSVELPRTHRDIEKQDRGFGPVETAVYYARGDVIDYEMIYLGIPPGMALNVSPEQLREAIVSGAAMELNGTLSNLTPIEYEDGFGLEASFTLPVDGRPHAGKIRLLQFGDEIIVLVITAPSSEVVDGPVANRFFNSLEVDLN